MRQRITAAPRTRLGYRAAVRVSLRLSSSLALAISGPLACTDGGAAARAPGVPARTQAPTPGPDPGSVTPVVPRNSDGSRQVLPPGPPSRPPYTLVLDYFDFGPQALSFSLIGMSWWQWEPGGSWEPGDRFDVRVVVYRGISEEVVAAQYPTVEDEADYRYVSFADAMAYFDHNIADIEGEPSLLRLHDELIATRARVRQAMGVADPRAVP